MKTFVFVSFVLFICGICVGQDAVLATGAYTGPTTFSEDPNLNPNWDWEQGDVMQGGVPRYFIFLQDKPNTGEYAATLPWRQQSSWTGLEDRKKEDGWILLARDFGSPERRLISTNPYFVLYNQFRSVVRVFVLLMNVPTSFTFSTMELKTYHKESGALAHLAPIAFAMDKVQNMYKNASSAAIPSLPLSHYWVYGDFPLALDNSLTPTGTTEVPASLRFEVYGTILTEVKLETDGFAAQGSKKFIQDFMAKNNFGSPGFSLRKDNMPNIDVPFNLPNVSMKATAPDWGSLQNYFGNLKIDMAFGSLSSSNSFKTMFDGFGATLSALSIASPLNISGLDMGGIFNFFVGGGMKPTNIDQTPPTFISSHYSTTGTLTTKNKFASVTIPIPASRQNFKALFNSGEVGLVRNDPIGLVTLNKTPQVYRKTFRSTMYDVPITMAEYELADIPEISLNQSSGLELKKCEVSLIGSLSTPNGYADYDRRWVIQKANKLKDQRYLFEFDSPRGTTIAEFRSMPAPLMFSKGRTIQLSVYTPPSDIKLRIKAVLKRKDDPSAQPVVLIVTYNTDVIQRNDLMSTKLLPTIPPQALVCTIPSSGGVRVSWDRNIEKNIKHYIVERSINNSAYITLGTTQDTVFTDNEVQKTITAYQAFRKNAPINYRVRAYAEWNSIDLGDIESQYSDYSNAITIQGSIYTAPLEKRSTLSVIPESNSLSQNFPNPFNPTTTIYYGVKDEGVVILKIFNALGQEVATLVNERKGLGYHYAEWNAAGLPSGMYFYNITVGDFSKTEKMTLLK